MVRFVVAAVVLAACAFHRGEYVPIAGRDAAPDVDASDAAHDAPADAGKSCLAKWMDHTVRFSAPVAITELNTSNYEDDPFLTPDELTIYFVTNRTGTMGDDLFSATRLSITAPFNSPQAVPSLDTAANESKMSMTADGLDAFVNTNRTGSVGGSYDVWETTRTLATQPFGTFSETNLVAIDTNNDERDPAISRDGKDLYLSLATSPQTIGVATRAQNGTFAAAVAISEIASTSGDADPTPSVDEKVLVFSSNRTAAFMQGNIWYATRTTVPGLFGAPLLVPDVNSDSGDGGPFLSDDGCHLYFVSYRSGNGDLYVATVL